MTYSSRAPSYSKRWPAFGVLALLAAFGGALNASGCSDDDDDDGAAGDGGSSSAGDGGSAGSSTAGTGGSGMAGSGSLPGAGPTGSIEVLNDDATSLLGPTTVALRGQNLWFTNGQLGVLFANGTPALPFSARSVPLAGGALGADQIELPGATFFPEGIAAAADGTLYVGSVGLHTIVRIPADSLTAQAFVPDTVPERSVIGMKVDEERELLWFCDSDPTDNPGAAAVVGVNLSDGLEVVRHDLQVAGAASVFCNDVLVDPAGNVWASESQFGVIFRIPAADALTGNRAVAWLTGGEAAPPPNGFGVNGLALVGGQLIAANSDGRYLFVVDPASSDPVASARRIVLSETGKTGDVPLCGPDGILAVPGSTDELIVIENGGCMPSAPRVIKVTLSLD
jgi:sugar lactone lactonase YvrE